jgi:hypothetical protein
MEIGEVWAYRARSLDPLVGVEVLRHGTKKPARALVRFVDIEFEGRQEWVPPGRLKVLWSEVAEFIADEARWEAVTAESPRDTPEASAAWLVFDLVVDEELAVLESYRAPYLRVVNAQALADWLGWAPSDLRSHPASFDSEGGDLISPWTTAMAVARRAAELSPARLLDYVDKEERDAAREAVYGRHYASSGRRRERFTATERWIEVDNENGRAVRNLLRTWCGAETVTEREELNALWHEIRRVGQVAEEAIEALRAAGRAGNADRLRTKLDTSVDTLRARD